MDLGIFFCCINIQQLLMENADPFFCEKCAVKCSNKCNYNQHLLTRKHKNTTKYNKKNAENAGKYKCEKCAFVCSNKSNYTKHLLTRKHIDTTGSDGNMPDHTDDAEVKLYECECSKTYKYRSSLYNHQKTCKSINSSKQGKNTIVEILLKENTDFKNIMLDVVKSNIHLQQHCSDLQKQFNEVCKNTNSHNKTYINNTNNSHNKTFNLQFFLNEQCKDAMNLSDFVKSITLQLSDLENVGKLGYVEGISNIMIKKLNEMDIYKRPVHCSDAKRETLYVKDEDCWEKEPENNPRLRKAIRHISKKNSDLLTTWSDKNPASKNNQSKENNKYMVMIQQAMGGSGEIADNENKIIKKLAKVFLIEKN
jgi:hypothetical protein